MQPAPHGSAIPHLHRPPRSDAFVDYVTIVEAEDAQAAADLVHEGSGFVWEERGVVEFDARRVVTLDDDGEEIESRARRDF